jgi:hypothetical protein
LVILQQDGQFTISHQLSCSELQAFVFCDYPAHWESKAWVGNLVRKSTALFSSVVFVTPSIRERIWDFGGALSGS